MDSPQRWTNIEHKAQNSYFSVFAIFPAFCAIFSSSRLDSSASLEYIPLLLPFFCLFNIFSLLHPYEFSLFPESPYLTSQGHFLEHISSSLLIVVNALVFTGESDFKGVAWLLSSMLGLNCVSVEYSWPSSKDLKSPESGSISPAFKFFWPSCQHQSHQVFQVVAEQQ